MLRLVILLACLLPYAIFLGCSFHSDRKQIRLEKKKLLKHEDLEAVTTISFSHDESLVAAGCHGGAVHVWRVRDGNIEAVLNDHSGTVTSIAFSPSGRLIAIACEDRKVRVWDIKEQQIKTIFEGHKAEITSVVFLEDQTVISAGMDRTIQVWDSGSGKIQAILRTEKMVYCLALVSATGTLVSGGGDYVEGGSELVVWDLKKSEAIFRSSVGSFEILSVAISPNKKVFAASTIENIVFWDIVSKKELCKVTHSFGKMYSIAFSFNGEAVFSGDSSGHICAWDAKTGGKLTELEAHKGDVYSLVSTITGKTVASGGADGFVHLWTVEDQAPETESEDGKSRAEGDTRSEDHQKAVQR